MAKFLYIEDDEDRAERAKLWFQRDFPDDALITVTNFPDAVEALKTLEPFDAVISDFQFPGKPYGNQPDTLNTGGVDIFDHLYDDHLPIAYCTVLKRETVVEALHDRDPAFDTSNLVVLPISIEAIMNHIRVVKETLEAKRPNPEGPASKLADDPS